MKRGIMTIDAMPIRQLRNACYDMLIAGYNRNSKWYQQDCDDCWKGLLKKNRAELVQTYKRWYAINNISESEMRRHCQFDGIGF